MTRYYQPDRKKSRMYGLPKTHKQGTPLHPILSMTDSSHHELGKWLAGLLQPVLKRFSSNCISNSFTFAKTVQNLDIDPNVFRCSFDVSSLFANVPLDETIKICSDALYDECDSPPIISKKVFVELMKSATSSVEFSFNNTMYKQTDGVAMGSPLDPAWANIFAGCYEEKLFSQTQKSPICFRYVEDMFAIFNHDAEADKLLTKFNCLHPSLKNSPLKKRKKNVYRFLMFTPKEQILTLKPVYTGNPLSPANIYVGSPLVDF